MATHATTLADSAPQAISQTVSVGIHPLDGSYHRFKKSSGQPCLVSPFQKSLPGSPDN
jgi:hypothetical protein